MESGCEQILKITDRILDGGEITEEEAQHIEILGGYVYRQG